MKPSFLLQHPTAGFWISQEDADDFTGWKRIGIRTRVESELCRSGDLSTPTTADAPFEESQAAALTKQRRAPKKNLSA